MCHRQDEDGKHLLFSCKYAKSVWRYLQLEGHRATLVNLPDAKAVSEYILSCSVDVQVWLTTTLWVIWSVRNATNAGDPVKQHEHTCASIQRYVLDFASMSEPVQRQNDVSHTRALRWTRPSEGVLNINVDGAFCEELKTGG
ncbi:hypothetical protein U9M48_014290 [Paspalum notatum var. saurae]|uniref:Reverse transcriptase zinc-binding domain-containing protein n=1 Tax=Paspalum notatum var. saurae TaxID=547442 RepID=A0AAQ3WKM4_PASNO